MSQWDYLHARVIRTRVVTFTVAAAVMALTASCVALPRRGELGLRKDNTLTLPRGAQVKRDIAYGADSLEKMDLYIPAGAKNAPVIFMVHGGGWRRGDKAMPGVVNNKVEHWLPKGFIFISANYRLVPQVTPLQEAYDVSKAVAFAQKHAASWGGDSDRFILMGHSAGAHLVTLITAAPEIPNSEGVTPWLGTIPLDSAAFNVVKIMEGPHFSLYDTAFGTDKTLWREASPTLRLKTKPVPMLLVHSAARKMAAVDMQDFADKVKSLGGKVTILPEELNHGEINADLGLDNDYTKKVDAFIRSLLK